MKKIYYLSTCDTCKKIMNSLNLKDEFTIQDLKTDPINSTQLQELYDLAGSYESLLNKRARLYKERGLKDKILQENDIKNLILEHYTFLKRPVFIIDDQIFIGNSKATVQSIVKEINEK